MRVLFDTNVVLDLLQARQPFVEDAEILFAYVETGKIEGLLCATTVTTIHYLLFKTLSNREATTAIRALLNLFEIAAVNRIVLEDAVASDGADFEDTVLWQSAFHAKADLIVTRDAKGFAKSKIPVYTPAELCKLLNGQK